MFESLHTRKGNESPEQAVTAKPGESFKDPYKSTYELMNMSRQFLNANSSLSRSGHSQVLPARSSSPSPAPFTANESVTINKVHRDQLVFAQRHALGELSRDQLRVKL